MTIILKQALICSAVLFAVSRAFSEPIVWSYADVGNWSTYFPDCGGVKQSPIDIVTSQSTVINDITVVTFDWTRKHTVMNTVTTNTGYTVTFTSEEMEESITINNEVYRLHKILYHWGSDATKGSEHSIDNKFYSGEVQFVHFKLSHGTYEEAETRKDGLAIVSIFLEEEIGKTRDNKVFQGFKSILQNVTEPYVPFNLKWTEKTIESKQLIPGDNKYFVYSGSLTTPPCTETVIWVVFKTPVPVSNGFLEALRALKKSDSEKVVNNFRPVNLLAGREIFKSETDILYV